MSLIGTTLGNYRIDRLLGEGGMGAVYQAYDLTLQRDVAIKLIHPHFARRTEFRDRFVQEARIMARLDHPGIVRVYVLGKEGDLMYLPMEFIKGGNLRQLLDKMITEKKWIPLDEAVSLMRQLCQTVEYAHQHGVLHRDIKPANLMLKPEDTDGLPFRIVLTDLGLAKLLQGLGLTQEGTYLGTPAYMSPEQAAGGDTSPCSDVYSLGVLLFELAVGGLPFPIRTPTEALRYHTQEPPPRPRSLRPDLPESLERVILRALEKKPDNRYSSAAEMAAALLSSLGTATEIGDRTTLQDVSLMTKYVESVISPAAPAKPQTASLMTMFDDGSSRQRGESIFAGQSVAPSTQTRIQIVFKGAAARFLPLPPTATIGRGSSNDIPLADPKASQRHAQITWDGMEYYVMDLNSRNGTYLGNTKLLPGIPEVWPVHQILRIGDTWLRILRPDLQNGVQSSAGSIYTRSVAGVVAVSVTPQRLSVEPGESASATLSLVNQSPNVDHFSISITGVPNDWINSQSSGIQLMPGEQKTSSFDLNVPRSAKSRAGDHSIKIRVTSERDASQFVETRLALTIGAYSEFNAEIQPQRVRSGQTGRLTITNLGNADETFSVRFSDSAGELTIEPAQSQARVAPGSTNLVLFHSKENQRRWIGGEKLHPYSAQISLPDSQNQNVHAEMISKGMIPTWMLPTVMLICLACLMVTVPFLFNILPVAPAPTIASPPAGTLPNTQMPGPSIDPAFAQTQTAQVQQIHQTQTSLAQQGELTQTAGALFIQQTSSAQFAQQTQAVQTQEAGQTQMAALSIQQTQTSLAQFAQQTQAIQTQEAGQIQTSQALSLTPPTSIPLPTPLLYLSFDGDVRDHSVNSLETRTNSSFEFVQGVKGLAAHFDGSGEAVEVPGVVNLPISEEMTLEFWVNMENWRNPNQGSAHIESIASLGVFYGIDVDFDTWTLGALLSTENTADFITLHGGQVLPGQWHHVALVYRGKEQKAYLFLDGLQVDSLSVTGKIPPNNPNAFTVGTWFEQNQAFAGLVDEMRLYNVGLSNSSIQKLATHP